MSCVFFSSCVMSTFRATFDFSNSVDESDALNMLTIFTGCHVPTHLKVLPGSEREGPGGLLWAPASRQERVSDEDAFLQTRVEMKSDVTATGCSQVDAETDTNTQTLNEPERSVAPSPAVISVLVPVCVLIELSSDCDAASNTQSSHQLTSKGDTLQNTRTPETLRGRKADQKMDKTLSGRKEK